MCMIEHSPRNPLHVNYLFSTTLDFLFSTESICFYTVFAAKLEQDHSADSSLVYPQPEETNVLHNNPRMLQKQSACPPADRCLRGCWTYTYLHVLHALIVLQGITAICDKAQKEPLAEL